MCRAGASTISELQYLGLPAILVPSPFVAENHQYYNAKALADVNAARLVLQSEIEKKLLFETVQLIHDEHEKFEISSAIKKLAVPDAAFVIANHLLELARSKKMSRV